MKYWTIAILITFASVSFITDTYDPATGIVSMPNVLVGDTRVDVKNCALGA